MCAARPDAETTIRLAVPKQVAAEAAARASGNAAAPPPVLMLENLEVGAGEGLTIQVLGPAEPGSSKPRPVLGVAATVGSPQRVPKAPLRRLTLAVPLNDKASRLLAGKSEVSLTLQVEESPGRPPLKFKRAYFEAGEGSTVPQ
ncbi:MAG TPA: hypothetical protein VGX68_25880 [Thermoanaerobaculia bacterium]|jgi:hypothetical protein|nr:hypothetical protein [Thermoanaerobaculia bacterium]